MHWLKPWTWGTITTLPTQQSGGRVKAAQKPSDQIEKKPERRDLARIVEDMRADYQVSFCERILFANIGAIAVSVTTDNEALADVAEKLQTLWDNTLATMGDSIAYGRVAYELEWEASGAHQLPKRCEALPFRETRMKLCEGHFDGIAVKAENNEWLDVLPVNAWWLAIDATVQRPHGQSRFLDAPYEVWKDKSGAKKNRRTATSKWALRGPILRGPITDFDEQTGQNYDVMTAMTPAVDTWSQGGLFYLPNDRDMSFEGDVFKFTVEQADLQGFDPNALNATIERLDVEMARAFGIAEQTIMEAGGVGTYGSITQKMLLLFAVCEGILDQWVRSFEKYVVGKFEEVNGLAPGSITLTYTSLSKRPDAFIFEAIKLLLSNPEFVTAIMAGVDIAKLLEDAGFPVTEQMQAALAAAGQRLAAATAAGAPLPAVPAGEMSGLGRRQWQNNRKAINDVLQDVIAGTTSDVMAKELLQSLGVPAERAQVFIDDAKDGKVDDAELNQPAAMSDRGKALAQVPIPRQGFKVPDTAQVLNAGLREFDRLFDELVTAMSKKASQSTLNGIRKQIVTLEAELRTVGRLLGMLSPWQPRAVKYAGGTVPDQAQPMPMTLADNGYKFPWIEDAVDFLESKGVVTAEQFAKMAEADRVHVFSAPGIDTTKQLKNIQTKLAKSLADGDDLPTFRKSIEADVAQTRAQTETMYRTETKRGYVAGLDKALAAPLVRDEFPAVMFSATSDQRVRDSHWDLDGFVCLRDDPAYNVLKRAAGDYQCRCAIIPLSMEDAESYGIKTYSDLPGDVRAKYA